MERLDKILVQTGLAVSRTQAEDLIKKGDVLVGGKVCDKPGKQFDPNIEIKLLNEVSKWVSRGALKLEFALKNWNIETSKGNWLDIGASTGGFTQVLLDFGAPHVTCIDVGHSQLHPLLQSDSRITSFEKTNVRSLTSHEVPEAVFGCVVDVSFISLTKVIPFLTPFIQTGGDLIVLLKPQFEVGKKGLNKKGVVTKAELYPNVIDAVKECAKSSQFHFISCIDSPILGGDGNKEFLLHFKKNSAE